MGWVPTATRRSGRLQPVDVDDDELPINGFACEAIIQAMVIACPACGACYRIRARPPVRHLQPPHATIPVWPLPAL